MDPKWRYRWLGLFLSLAALLAATPAAAQAIFGSDSAWGNFRWGEPRETRQLNREQAIAKYNYCPTGGCVLRLDSVEVRPRRARQGEGLVLNTAYTILTPEQITIPVTISREIFFQGKSLGKTKAMESRKPNGTWTEEISFSLPPGAAAGDYTVVTQVTTGYGTDQKNAQFRVE